jgi:hypothetical protein
VGLSRDLRFQKVFYVGKEGVKSFIEDQAVLPSFDLTGLLSKCVPIYRLNPPP